MFLRDFLEIVIYFDKYLFYLINRVFANGLFDSVLPFLRIPAFWIPLYLFIILFVATNFKKNKIILWILFFLLAVSFCDIISSHVIKTLIYRPRPCYDPYWHGVSRHLTTYCSHTSSFTSSHACNHFGMAFFLFLTLKKDFGRYSYLFFIWAFLISYSQVYVGVHYPLDVICGGIIGGLIGKIISSFYLKIDI